MTQRPLETLQVEPFMRDLPQMNLDAMRIRQHQELHALGLDTEDLKGKHVLNASPGYSILCLLPLPRELDIYRASQNMTAMHGYRLIPSTLGDSEIPRPEGGYDTVVCIPGPGDPLFRMEKERVEFFSKVGSALRKEGRFVLPENGLETLLFTRAQMRECLGATVRLDAPGRELDMNAPVQSCA